MAGETERSHERNVYVRQNQLALQVLSASKLTLIKHKLPVTNRLSLGATEATVSY